MPRPPVIELYSLLSVNGADGSTGFIINGITAFNNSGNSVMRAPQMGGMPTSVAMNQNGAAGIAVDGGNVYWTTANSIVRSNTNGNNITTLAQMQNIPTTIAVDTTSVYWGNVGAGTVMKMTPK